MFRITWMAAALALLGGCASVPLGGDDPSDPLEGMNRAFFAFNDTVDKAIAAPISEAYVELTPDPVRAAVYNFFDNLSYPGTALNNLLQGKVERAMEDVGRVVFNSTLGLGGLIDFAGDVGFARHDEDFGQTLGVWGLEPGPYLELPLLGPSSVRDAFRFPVGSVTGGLFWMDSGLSFPLGLLERVETRARLSGAIEIRDKNALDPYAFQREAYLQRRRNLVFDGNPPLEDLDLPGATQ